MRTITRDGRLAVTMAAAASRSGTYRIVRIVLLTPGAERPYWSSTTADRHVAAVLHEERAHEGRTGRSAAWMAAARGVAVVAELRAGGLGEALGEALGRQAEARREAAVRLDCWRVWSARKHAAPVGPSWAAGNHLAWMRHQTAAAELRSAEAAVVDCERRIAGVVDAHQGRRYGGIANRLWAAVASSPEVAP